MKNDYDVIIIGSGPAGFSASMQASKFGKKVLVVEANPKYLGGAWINTGTVPSKALREAAYTIHKFSKQFGRFEKKKPYMRFKMAELLSFKSSVLENRNIKAKDDLVRNEVITVRGYGRIVDENTVEVTDALGKTTTHSTDYILVATGSRPSPPTRFEIDHDTVRDSDSILELDHIPSRLVILGGGVQALEFATIFSVLGTKVTMLSDRGETLDFVDHEIREHFYEALEHQNVLVVNDVTIQDIHFNQLRNRTEVHFKAGDDDELQVVETEQVLYLGGRKPNTSDIGLEKVKIKADRDGIIAVDRNYRTKAPTVYAAGDVVGFPQLASVSFTQGRLASCDMFGIPAKDVSPHIPIGIYSIPEIASIGLTEQEAYEKGIDFTVGRSFYKNLTRAIIGNTDFGLLKLVFSTTTFELLGVHIVGENASELIHIGQAQLSIRGDVRYFINHIMNYPTYSEAYRKAAFNGVNRVYKAGIKYKKQSFKMPVPKKAK